MSNQHLPTKLQDMITKAMATIAAKDPAWANACASIKWEINPNLRRVLGCASYFLNSIEISGPYFNSASEDAVYNTVTHELAHFIAYKLYHCKGHGMMWKYVHANLGGTAERCTKAENYGYVPVRNVIKRVVLEKGGKEFKITLARWHKQRYGIEAAGYKYVRTVKIDNDKETLLHSAKEAKAAEIYLDSNLNRIS
jgi:predicted SprT family Zn-dependent metalloprotease